MKLPHGDRAYIGDKLDGYVFSATHDIGKHKRHGFAAVLGITPANKSVLVEALVREAAESDDAKALPDRGFGPRYQLDFALQTLASAAIVRSGWIVRTGEDFPRLTTCYILKPL